MAVISIEGGCTQNMLTGVWYYPYEDNAGWHVVEFMSAARPKIGDSVDTVSGQFIPLVGYKINQSPGMQAANHKSHTWPDGNYDF